MADSVKGRASLFADGPNEWLNGVKGRAEDTGDGYVRLPLGDWQGVVSCFEWGEVLLGDAIDALKRIADEFPDESLRGRGDYWAENFGRVRDIAKEALVTVGVRPGTEASDA